MTGRVIVGLLWLTILAFAAGVWNVRGGTPEVTAPHSPATPRIDLYGNPVENAIEDYRIDGHGHPYERHSPHNEIRELASPAA